MQKEEEQQVVTDYIMASIADDVERYLFVSVSDASDGFHMSKRIATTLDGKLVYCEKRWFVFNEVENRDVGNFIIDAYRQYIDYSLAKTYELVAKMGLYPAMQQQLMKMVTMYETLRNCSSTFVNHVKFFLRTSLGDDDFLFHRRLRQQQQRQQQQQKPIAIEKKRKLQSVCPRV